MIIQNNKAFTLVELIVVITILAVLATVAFISFQGYSTESRDTKRKTDLATVSKGLQVYLAANSQVPEPSETKTTVSFSGDIIITQGYAGDSVLNTLRIQEAKDPVDENFYTYSINANQTKFQLVGLLENNQTTNNFLGTKSFADYSDRTIYTVGDSVGVLLDNTKTPIQELGDLSLELENNSMIFTAVLNKQNIVTQSGSILKRQILASQDNIYGWRALDKNCQIDDIVVGNQVWAGCNSTLGTGLEWGKSPSGEDIIIHSCYSYNSENNPEYCDSNSLYMGSNQNPRDYFDQMKVYGNNQNSDNEFDTIWGKLYNWDDAMNSACPANWSVPSDEDWSLLEKNLGCPLGSENRDGPGCDGLGWETHNSKTNTDNLVNALQIPLSGLLVTNRTQSRYRGGNTYLWSRTIEGNYAYRRSFYWGDSGIDRSKKDINFSFSVRCIKD